MATFLDLKDFDLIVSERDPLRRAGLACRLFADFDAGALDGREMLAAMSVLRAIARDGDSDVRARLARFCAPSARLPRDVAVRLAGDIRAVAMPVIGASPVLPDDCLVDLAASPEPWRQTAIARRANLSRAVSAALIEVAGPEACQVLLGNSGASLPKTAFTRLGERFAGHHGIREAMLTRPGAPAAVVEAHLTAVADRLSRFVAAAGWLDGRTARRSAGDAVDQALITYASQRAPDVVQDLAERWAQEGRITAGFLVRAAICGSQGVFDHAVAALARLPAIRVRTLLRERGGYGLRGICAKVGFERATEDDIARIRLARAAIVDRDPRAPSALMARRIAALAGEPAFAPDHPLSPASARIARDIARVAEVVRPEAVAPRLGRAA